MKYIFALFLFLFGTIITVSHFFVYFSINYFFDISKPAYKRTFLAVMLVLTLSFILSTIFMHVHFNIFTKYLYIISSVWLGYLAYMIISLLLAWFIYGVTLICGCQTNLKLIAGLFLIGSLIFTGWGVHNAFDIKIKNVDIKINNLPDQWRGKKIVQLSDIHLGPINGQNFLNSVIKKTNTIDPDLVLITGDYFDGLDGDADKMAVPLNNLKNKNGIYFSMGNHEVYYGVDKVLEAFKNTDVKILQDQMVDINGLQIIGTNYRGPEVATKIESALKLIDPNKPSIVMSHVPINLPKYKNAGASLILCGHTHMGQMWPFKYITRLVFSGFDYGLKNINNTQVYTTSGIGTWGPPIRTNGDSEIVVFNLQ